MGKPSKYHDVYGIRWMVSKSKIDRKDRYMISRKGNNIPVFSVCLCTLKEFKLTLHQSFRCDRRRAKLGKCFHRGTIFNEVVLIFYCLNSVHTIVLKSKST